MILIACGLLAAFPAGILFPAISKGSARLAERRQRTEKSNGSHEMGVRSSGETPDAETQVKTHGV
jgi:hypothetical protein